MDTNNWRPTQGANGAIGDPTMESGDWRAQLQADSRQRIVNKIMDTLKRHLPFSGHEGLQELKKIAVRFEEKIYTAATSQSDYLRKISLKMLTMETRSQNPMSDPMQSNSTANSVNPSDPGSQVMQQVNNQGQQLPISVQSNNMQQGQQMMSQSMHNNIGSTGMQGSTGLSSALPPGSGLQQPTMSNVAGQNSNLQNAQNMSSVQQNTVGNTMGNNNFANQRQIPGRQQLVPQQQLPQTQNSQYLYQQQQLHQMAKQKLQQPSMQPHMQQPQQQQNMLQPGHLQPSQQSVMQPTMMQTSSLSTVVQNQQPVVPQSSQPLMNHQQSVLRPQRQQPVQPIQQQVQQTQQNPIGQQTNATNMQQNQLIGQQNNYSDMQQQQQQRLIGQQNKLSSLQQPQQQLIGQHNNLSSMQPQQSGQQQQLLGNQSGNTGMQTNQHSVQQMLQSNKIPIQQQNQQSSANLLPTQVQQSQPQLQQQVMSHMQSQPGQLQQQQQVGMQQQPNLLQRDMQQRLPTTGGFQQQNMIDHQKQLFQQQRAMPEASSTSLDSTATDNPNGGDWQEEVYQKIKAMKDLYLLDLNDMHQKILSKLQQHDSLPQQPKNEQLEKLKVFKNMLERFMQFLQIPKHGILANYKDKLGTYEKQIINVINSNRRKPAAPQQQAQAQALPAHMQSLQQSQQTHSQFTQVQSHESQKSLHGSTESMQPNNMGNLPQNTAVSISGGSNAQQNVMTSILPGSNLDPGQNTSINSLQPMMSQSMHNNIGSTGMQGSSNLSSALPPGSALQQPTVTHVAGQNLNLQNVRNTSSVQRSQFTGQQNNYHPMFLLQQQMMIQQRLIEQQIRLLSLQQQSQQLIGQNLNLQNLQNTSTVQELLQSNKMPIQQHYQQGSANLLPTQVQQWQPQLPQQRDMQQKVPTTGGLQQQNMIDQQKQTVTPESSETSLDSTGRIGNPNGGDWQEEVYQKIKAMKELYLQDLIDIHQIFLSKLQQHDSLPQQPKNEQIEKLKLFKNVLERYMQFLQTVKHEIFENHEDKLATYEKQIINVINSNRRKPVAPQQQAQQTFSQSPQIQSHENQ